MLVASLILIGAGAVIFFRVVGLWAQSGFGALSAVR
jgi:hypothetical protein